MKRIFATGYKAHELGIFDQKNKGIHYIKKTIARKLRPLVEDGLEWVVTSGQWGTELWAAEAVLELKKEYPSLRLAIVTPFLNQEERWSDDKKELYRSVTARADMFRSLSEAPYENPSQFARLNAFVFAKTDGLLLLYDEETEGSPKFIKAAAEKKNFPIVAIGSFDLQETVEEEQMNQFNFDEPADSGNYEE